jgi:hypothetical protein
VPWRADDAPATRGSSSQFPRVVRRSRSSGVAAARSRGLPRDYESAPRWLTNTGASSVRLYRERDVVEDVVSREVALVGPVKDRFDESGQAGGVAVVKCERRQIDGRIRQPVKRLRARRHDQCLGHVSCVEGAQLLVTRELSPGHVSTLAVTDPELIEDFDNFAFDEILQYGNLRASLLV